MKSVNTMNMKPKTRRVRYVPGKTAAWKKAIVTLTEDSETIEFFEGMLFVRLEQADKSGKIIARNQQQVFFDKTGWTDVEFAIKSAKDAAWTYLYIQSDNLAATDKVRYDDIKIEETEAADRGMVINGSFEKGTYRYHSS